jgi:outer membrane protein TolC
VIEKLETLKKDRLTKITEINALAIRPINQDLNPNYEDITVNGLLLKPLDEVKILEISKENYPKLLSQAAVVDKVMAQVQLAKKEYIPDLNVNAFYGFRNNSDFGSLFGIGLETSLPVFFNSKQRQKVLEAKELVQAQKERLEDIKINTLSSARKLFIQIQKSQILTDILDTALLPQSNLAVESSMATYKVGKTDFPSVLDSINDLLEFQIQYYMELSMGLKSIAVLEPLLGKEIGDFN